MKSPKSMALETLGATAVFFAALFAGGVARPASGSELFSPAIQKDAPTPTDEVESILAEFNEELSAFWDAYGATDDEGERNKVYETLYPKAEKYVDRLSAVVDC